METNPVNPQTQGDELLAKAKANKGKLTGALIFCIVVVVAAFAWFFINQSGNKKAAELAGKAALGLCYELGHGVEMDKGKAAELYQEAAEAGHKSGNRAKLEVAIRYYNDGKYEDALKYLNDASVDDEIVAAGAQCLKGDCYVNLDKLDDAVKAFRAHQARQHLPRAAELQGRVRGLQDHRRQVSRLPVRAGSAD